MKGKKLKSRIGRLLLLGSLASTRAISKTDFRVPPKWRSVVENFRGASLIAYSRLSELDREAEKELLEKEEMLERKIGSRKFYSEEELDRIKDMHAEN